jgi:hypothetical protein
MKILLKIVRWLLFLPLAFALLYIVWFGVTWASVSLPWWGMLIVFVILATPLMAVSAWPVALAPNRKVGAVIIAVLLIGIEIDQIEQVWKEWPNRMLFWRILVDLKILRDLYAAYHLMDVILKDSFNEDKDDAIELIEKTAQLCSEWEDLPTDEESFLPELINRFGGSFRPYANEIFERAWEIYQKNLRDEAIADGDSKLIATLDAIEANFSEQIMAVKIENSNLEELYAMRESAVSSLVEHLAAPYAAKFWNLPSDKEQFAKIFVSDHGEEFSDHALAVFKRAKEIAEKEYQRTGTLYS